MAVHLNNGSCPHCLDLFARYPGFDQSLLDWFKAFQAAHPEAHISCAGRGRVDQEAAYARGASKAHWKQSAHNYNAAIDFFVEIPGSDDIYPKDWFLEVLAPEIPDWLQWGWQWPGTFKEMPHVEVKDWLIMVQAGQLQLVE